MEQTSVAAARANLSELVERVASRGERIVLTSRGRPKVVLVSVADAEALDGQEENVAADDTLFDEIREFVESVRQRRKGVPLPPSIDDIYAIREDSLAKYGRSRFHRGSVHVL